jgi:hypothetical protein
VQRDMLPPSHPHTQLQAIESVQSSDALPIHQPAFPTQQHPDPQIPKPGPGMGQIANPYPERRLIRGPTPSIPRRSPKLRQAAGPQATDLKRPVKPGSQFSTACGP